MNLRIGIVSTLRGAEKMIDSFILYHRAVGFDHLFLFFDDPDDPAIDRAQHHEAVTIIPHDAHLRRQWQASTLFAAGFIDEVMGRQTLNLELAIGLAAEHGLDWLLHIDQDELFYSARQSVHDHFADLTVRNVACAEYPNHEAVPEQIDLDDFFRHATLFKKAASARAVPDFDDRQKALLQAMPQLGLRFFHFYTGVKSAARVQPGLRPFGTHKFKPPPGSLTATARTDPVILHYPCCGFGHFWDKFTILGARPYTWWGRDATDRLGLFFRDALAIGRQGARQAARAFYAHRYVLADEADAAVLIEHDLCCRITEPARILENMGANPADFDDV